MANVLFETLHLPLLTETHKRELCLRPLGPPSSRPLPPQFDLIPGLDGGTLGLPTYYFGLRFTLGCHPRWLPVQGTDQLMRAGPKPFSPQTHRSVPSPSRSRRGRTRREGRLGTLAYLLQ